MSDTPRADAAVEAVSHYRKFFTLLMDFTRFLGREIAAKTAELEDYKVNFEQCDLYRVRALSERDELRQQLQAATDSYFCPFCKAVLPKQENVMRVHIQSCEKHPLAAERKENGRLRQQLSDLQEVMTGFAVWTLVKG